MEVKQVLNVVTEVSCQMLKYGGEVYRAEESVRYICHYYGIEQVDVFAISTNIMVTITHGDECITKTRRIPYNQVDLTKVDMLNDLSRHICANRPEYADIQKRLAEIEAIAPYRPMQKALAVALISFAFAMIFGGTIWEGLVSCTIGLVVSVAQMLWKKWEFNKFLQITMSSFLMTALSFFAMNVSGGELHAQPILAGGLMVLVPGLALTNCMRDMMANDFVAGLTKFAEATMTALATALGVALVILGLYAV